MFSGNERLLLQRLVDGERSVFLNGDLAVHRGVAIELELNLVIARGKRDLAWRLLVDVISFNIDLSTFGSAVHLQGNFVSAKEFLEDAAGVLLRRLQTRRKREGIAFFEGGVL